MSLVSILDKWVKVLLDFPFGWYMWHLWFLFSIFFKVLLWLWFSCMLYLFIYLFSNVFLAKFPFILHSAVPFLKFFQVDDIPLCNVPEVIENYHICVVKDMRLDSKVISRASQMKLIMQFGVGLEGCCYVIIISHALRHLYYSLQLALRNFISFLNFVVDVAQ